MGRCAPTPGPSDGGGGGVGAELSYTICMSWGHHCMTTWVPFPLHSRFGCLEDCGIEWSVAPGTPCKDVASVHKLCENTCLLV